MEPSAEKAKTAAAVAKGADAKAAEAAAKVAALEKALQSTR